MYVSVMCAHTYIYIYICVCIHVYMIYVYIYIYMCVCVRVCFFCTSSQIPIGALGDTTETLIQAINIPLDCLGTSHASKNYHGPWTRGFKTWYPSWTWHNRQSTIFWSEYFLRLPPPKTNSRKWLYDIHRKPYLALLYKATYPLLI